jgi:hypothetical protein
LPPTTTANIKQPQSSPEKQSGKTTKTPLNKSLLNSVSVSQYIMSAFEQQITGNIK